MRIAFVLLDSYLLPLGIVGGFVLGIMIPRPGAFLAGETGMLPKGMMNQLSVCIIFFLSGVRLRVGEMKRGLLIWKGVFSGLFSTILVTPLASLALIYLPLQPCALSLGLGLFALMPTTLSVGTIMTKMAGGNGSLSVFLSIASNLIAIFILPVTVPLLIQTFRGSVAHLDFIYMPFDSLSMLLDLIVCILFPLLLGLGFRKSSGIHEFIDQHQYFIKKFAELFPIFIAWMNISTASFQIVRLQTAMVCSTAVAATILHIIYLLFNILIVKIFKLPPSASKAVVFCASQKALSVCITIISFLPPEIGEPGVLGLGATLGHFSQLIIDSIVSSLWVIQKPLLAKQKPSMMPMSLHQLPQRCNSRSMRGLMSPCTISIPPEQESYERGSAKCTIAADSEYSCPDNITFASRTAPFLSMTPRKIPENCQTLSSLIRSATYEDYALSEGERGGAQQPLFMAQMDDQMNEISNACQGNQFNS